MRQEARAEFEGSRALPNDFASVKRLLQEGALLEGSDSDCRSTKSPPPAAKSSGKLWTSPR